GDAEGPAVGQAELAALVGVVARLAELVLDVLQRQLLVVAFDREDFAEHAFEPELVALFGRDVELKEALVRLGLDVSQRRDGRGSAEAGKVRRFFRLDNTFGGDGHGSCVPPKVGAEATRRREQPRCRGPRWSNQCRSNPVREQPPFRRRWLTKGVPCKSDRSQRPG